MAKAEASASGVGFTGLLTILFIALKLLGKIDWTWTWVLSPIWISVIFVIGIIIFALIMAAWTGQLK